MTPPETIAADSTATGLTRGLAHVLEGRPPANAVAPGVGSTLLLGLLTAGLWPAWSMPAKLRNAARWRANLASDLHDWRRLERGETGDLPADPLTRPLSVIASALAVVAALAAVWVVLDDPHGLGRLWYSDPIRGDYPTLALAAFVTALGESYLLHWLAANAHLRHARRLLAAFRASAGLDATPKARPLPRWEYGFSIVPTTVGVVLAWAGLIWALPMLVACVAARRVVLTHDRWLTKALGGLVADGTSAKRPPEPVPATAERDRACPRDGCAARVAPDAEFCPRCGTSQRRGGSGTFT